MGIFTFLCEPKDLARYPAGEEYAPDYEPELERPENPVGKLWDSIEPYFGSLPPLEQDVLELMLKHRKTERDLAVIFSCSQAAISYRRHRAFARLKFLRALPPISRKELRRILEDALRVYVEHKHTGTRFVYLNRMYQKRLEKDLDILIDYLTCTCQTDVCTKYRCRPFRIFSIWKRALRELDRMEGEPAAQAGKYLRLVRENPLVLSSYVASEASKLKRRRSRMQS